MVFARLQFLKFYVNHDIINMLIQNKKCGYVSNYKVTLFFWAIAKEHLDTQIRKFAKFKY